MIQEEKQLLIQDICARLPYELKVEVCIKDKDIKTVDCVKYGTVCTYIRLIDDGNFSIKPYLRSLSSMTEEEKRMLWEELDKDMDILERNIDAPIISVYNSRCYRGNPAHNEIDFLNKNHFDWRGLIPMGLALEASNDMYKTK